MEPLRMNLQAFKPQVLGPSRPAEQLNNDLTRQPFPVEPFPWEKSYTRLPTYKNHMINIRRQVRAGEMPQVGNGYAFVIDRRPEGNKSDYIPANEYTRYFSQRQIPIAEVDHELFGHDTTHAPSYLTLFANARFADLIQAAAINALEDPQLCETFTEAVDQFSDNVLDFELGIVFEGDADKPLKTVNKAELHLRSLIELENRSLSADGDTTDELHAQLTEQLGLNGYRARALTHQEAQGARAEHMMGNLGLNATL